MIKDCRFDVYCLVRAIRTDLPADRYVDRLLPGDTVDWGYFRRGREKEEEGEEKPKGRCSSPALSVAREQRIVHAICGPRAKNRLRDPCPRAISSCRVGSPCY
ncbi:hypothetical protein GW17_00008577, partial [Ensete ventricosum]